eukprot:GHVH01002614.1.p1 GENE.GHVH01002614.1~~GHVH01002614.1.p1  ORF type:complete len:1144 (+),score=163.53 GHVH01002614.1:1444-4875(+)
MTATFIPETFFEVWISVLLNDPQCAIRGEFRDSVETAVRTIYVGPFTEVEQTLTPPSGRNFLSQQLVDRLGRVQYKTLLRDIKKSNSAKKQQQSYRDGTWTVEDEFQRIVLLSVRRVVDHLLCRLRKHRAVEMSHHQQLVSAVDARRLATEDIELVTSEIEIKNEFGLSNSTNGIQQPTALPIDSAQSRRDGVESTAPSHGGVQLPSSGEALRDCEVVGPAAGNDSMSTIIWDDPSCEHTHNSLSSQQVHRFNVLQKRPAASEEGEDVEQNRPPSEKTNNKSHNGQPARGDPDSEGQNRPAGVSVPPTTLAAPTENHQAVERKAALPPHTLGNEDDMELDDDGIVEDSGTQFEVPKTNQRHENEPRGGDRKSSMLSYGESFGGVSGTGPAAMGEKQAPGSLNSTGAVASNPSASKSQNLSYQNTIGTRHVGDTHLLHDTRPLRMSDRTELERGEVLEDEPYTSKPGGGSLPVHRAHVTLSSSNSPNAPQRHPSDSRECRPHFDRGVFVVDSAVQPVSFGKSLSLPPASEAAAAARGALARAPPGFTQSNVAAIRPSTAAAAASTPSHLETQSQDQTKYAGVDSPSDDGLDNLPISLRKKARRCASGGGAAQNSGMTVKNESDLNVQAASGKNGSPVRPLDEPTPAVSPMESSARCADNNEEGVVGGGVVGGGMVRGWGNDLATKTSEERIIQKVKRRIQEIPQTKLIDPQPRPVTSDSNPPILGRNSPDCDMAATTPPPPRNDVGGGGVHEEIMGESDDDFCLSVATTSGGQEQRSEGVHSGGPNMISPPANAPVVVMRAGMPHHQQPPPANDRHEPPGGPQRAWDPAHGKPTGPSIVSQSWGRQNNESPYPYRSDPPTVLKQAGPSWTNNHPSECVTPPPRMRPPPLQSAVVPFEIIGNLADPSALNPLFLEGQGLFAFAKCFPKTFGKLDVPRLREIGSGQSPQSLSYFSALDPIMREYRARHKSRWFNFWHYILTSTSYPLYLEGLRPIPHHLMPQSLADTWSVANVFTVRDIQRLIMCWGTLDLQDNRDKTKNSIPWFIQAFPKKDPDESGRVQVRVPLYKELQSEWEKQKGEDNCSQLPYFQPLLPMYELYKQNKKGKWITFWLFIFNACGELAGREYGDYVVKPHLLANGSLELMTV